MEINKTLETLENHYGRIISVLVIFTLEGVRNAQIDSGAFLFETNFAVKLHVWSDFPDILVVIIVAHQTKQDWLSPVYSGRLVHLLKFILHTPAR